MKSLPRFQYTFTPSVHMTGLAFLGLILFSSLGYWQLQRAHEKEQLIQKAHVARKTPLELKKTIKVSPDPYRWVHVKGRFMAMDFFLDNQFMKSQWGYDVLSPLVLSGDQVVLVDRGFIPRSTVRKQLPAIQPLVGEREFTGTVYYPSGKQWVLGVLFEKVDSNHIILEKIDVKWVADFLHKSVYPFIIRLDQREPDGFLQSWTVVSVPPARHKGYAVQWFAMALLVIVLWVSLNIKRRI